MNKKILILGVTGMLGYNLYSLLNDKYELYGTCRNLYDIKSDKIFKIEHTIDNIFNIIEKIKPDIIINSIAILRENNYEEKNNMIYANITIPLKVCEYCKEKKIYFMHFSTDAVFKSSGYYHNIEDSYSPESFYGLTKSLSEAISKDCLVLRICPIGFDKFKRKSLFNFIYDNKNENINGFTNVFFNGTTTIVIIKEIIKIIDSNDYIKGIRHITGPKISKYNLLKIINDEFSLNKNIIPLENPKISRLLKNDLTNPNQLNWINMIKELKIFIHN